MSDGGGRFQVRVIELVSSSAAAIISKLWDIPCISVYVHIYIIYYIYNIYIYYIYLLYIYIIYTDIIHAYVYTVLYSTCMYVQRIYTFLQGLLK